MQKIIFISEQIQRYRKRPALPAGDIRTNTEIDTHAHNHADRHQAARWLCLPPKSSAVRRPAAPTPPPPRDNRWPPPILPLLAPAPPPPIRWEWTPREREFLGRRLGRGGRAPSVLASPQLPPSASQCTGESRRGVKYRPPGSSPSRLLNDWLTDSSQGI